ncbi:aryl-alcohol dehydrogenase [Sistotremastrum suecicum HHB10207 ss-3]|uniref:Aryl-alcohol dehydrogenase n=1 Tax=Sistotremastrum suecicum HHB10207 ss-3 TaxID=1314776 RepID=A0A165Z3L8_9AGAM|nr:aryl-alcohol dehydrogenase [Sistotremastrum suecicum HHB10207 ss-3]
MAEPRKTSMQYVLKVSRIILGMMTYGSAEWQPWVRDEQLGMEHVKAAYDAGIQTFDTANVYSNGLSETILGKAIKEYNLPREEIVVMTKVFFTVGKAPGVSFFEGASETPEQCGYVNQHGLSRKHIFDSVKASLGRLQLEYIDVLQCHRFDPDTPIEETMKALHDVVQAGYVRYIGMSSCYAYQFNAMQSYAIQNRLTPFTNHYNLVYREEEREMMPTLKQFGVSSISWSPLARGLLARSSTAETRRGKDDNWTGSMYDSASLGNSEIIKRVEEIAKKRGKSMARIAVAWILSKNGTSPFPLLLPFPFPFSRPLFNELTHDLEEDEVRYLEEPYVAQGIVGHF